MHKDNFLACRSFVWCLPKSRSICITWHHADYPFKMRLRRIAKPPNKFCCLGRKLVEGGQNLVICFICSNVIHVIAPSSLIYHLIDHFFTLLPWMHNISIPTYFLHYYHECRIDIDTWFEVHIPMSSQCTIYLPFSFDLVSIYKYLPYHSSLWKSTCLYLNWLRSRW